MVKKTLHSSSFASAAIVAVNSLIVVGLAWPVSADAGQTTNGWVLTEPKRRIADPSPPDAPSLPAGAQSITPITFDIVLRRGPGNGKAQSVRQTVSRTAERIHFTDGKGREWLFEQNNVDPRRASAMVVHHSAKAIVLYEETDLRMTLGIRGWADVLTLGFASETLGGYKRTNERRMVAGVRFTRFASPRGDGGDVWWSDEESLPITFTIGEGAAVTKYTIGGIARGVDATLLRPATARFPSYRVLVLSDWLERH